jgi:flagellin
MSVINTNVSALYSQNAMKTNARAMSTAMEQLSTGTRVNSAKDDAAGLAIGQNMTSQIRGLQQAVRNVNDGINMMQTAEGAMVEQSNMLQRMRELAVQAMNGTYSNVQRGYLNSEFQALGLQIDRIATDTKWNDQSLLNGALALAGNASSIAVGLPTGADEATFTFQAGKDAGQVVSVDINAMTSSSLNLPLSAYASGIMGIGTLTTASSTLTAIETALETINQQRANIGAAVNRLAYAADNLTNIASNATQSRSTIMDTDYALATTQLAKTQIIQQAATAMLAQANQQPQGVMALLKG